jgi:hypothetical protein
MDHVESIKNDTTKAEDIREAAQLMFEKLGSYYNQTSEVCTIATVLDPNFKHHYYGDNGDARNFDIEHVPVSEIVKTVRSRFDRDYRKSQEIVELGESDDDESLFNNISKRRRVVFDDELDRYLQESPPRKRTDPIEWWRNKQVQVCIEVKLF